MQCSFYSCHSASVTAIAWPSMYARMRLACAPKALCVHFELVDMHWRSTRKPLKRVTHKLFGKQYMHDIFHDGKLIG
jgi:hypothetical protein